MNKKTDIVRINFTLNPNNDLDKEVIEAVEKLKNEGFNISARIKKLLLDDARGVQSIKIASTPAPTTVVASAESVKTESNVEEEDNIKDDSDNVDDGFEVDVSGLI